MGRWADSALERSRSTPTPGLGASPQPHPATAPSDSAWEQTGSACSHTDTAKAGREGALHCPHSSATRAIIIFSLISLHSEWGPSPTPVPLGPAFPLATDTVFLSRELFLQTHCGSTPGPGVPGHPTALGTAETSPAAECAEIPMQIPQIALFQPPQSTFFSSPAGTSCSCSWQCRHRSRGWEPLLKPALSKT